jgi:predicted nuclease of predicted toxin-antitoxin system
VRILLDECVPKRIKNELKSDHRVTTVVEEGWSGKKNGELIRLAEGKFDSFITIDQNLSYQQNLKNSKIAVILVVAKDNKFETIQKFIPKNLKTLSSINSGDFLRIT